MQKFRLCFFWFASVTMLRPLSSGQAGPVLTVMETRDAPGNVAPEKLDECLRLTLVEMNLDGRDLPRIVVYHVSQKTADDLGVQHNSIWKANVGGQPRYEMWIVGKPSTFLYSYMLASILQKHSQITVDTTQLSRIVTKVERGLNATVDARSFH